MVSCALLDFYFLLYQVETCFNNILRLVFVGKLFIQSIYLVCVDEISHIKQMNRYISLNEM